MEVVDSRNHHTDLAEEALVVQVVEACDHQEDAVDIAGILDLLVEVDNFEEDTVDVHNVGHLVADVVYIPIYCVKLIM